MHLITASYCFPALNPTASLLFISKEIDLCIEAQLAYLCVKKWSGAWNTIAGNHIVVSASDCHTKLTTPRSFCVTFRYASGI